MHLKSIITLLLFFVISNLQIKSLNDKIYQSQKIKIKGLDKEIEIQHRFRKQYINDIIALKRQNPKDTIVVVESYPVECFGCPAKFVQVFSKKKRRAYVLNFNGNEVTNYNAEPIETVENYRSDYDNYLHSDLKTIMEGLRKGKSVATIVKENNSNHCFDGSRSIYSIVFPSDRIESFKIRCWKN